MQLQDRVKNDTQALIQERNNEMDKLFNTQVMLHVIMYPGYL